MDRKDDNPNKVKNFINRSECIYHSNYSGNGQDTTNTDLTDITFTAKLKYVGSLISDKVVSCTSKLTGKVSEVLIDTSHKNYEADDCFSEYDNYDEMMKNEVPAFQEAQLDEIDEKIAMIESIFLGINSELSPPEPRSIGTQTNVEYCEKAACTGENCRHKVVIDEFPSHIDNGHLRFKPVSIIGPLLNSIMKGTSIENGEIDKNTNLRSTILKLDRNQ